MKTKGSITVYVCLILSGLLMLSAACIHSVYQAVIRVKIAAGMETGLYSTFAQYDRELLEKFDVFFLDGGCKTGEFRMDVIYDSVKNGMMYTLGNGCKVKDGGITGYVLATDENGKAFFEQALEAQKQRMGIQGVQYLTGTVQGQQTLERQAESPDPEAEVQYESSFEQSRKSELPKESEAVYNPVEDVKRLRKMGVLKLVMQDTSGLSGADLELKKLPSSRSLQQGVGVMEAYDGGSLTENVLFAEYILTHFPIYGEENEGSGIFCKAEYILEGKKNDTENMKAVVKKLLALREGMNLFYLYRDAGKSAQLDNYAMQIAAAFALPEIQPAVKAVLASCWAFAESIQDVRCLLKGGKVPMMKDASTWQTSYTAIGQSAVKGSEAGSEDRNGMSYKDYLRLLLVSQNKKAQIRRVLDMTEYIMRQERQEFRIDFCVEKLECEYQVQVKEEGSFQIRRSYSYRQ